MFQWDHIEPFKTLMSKHLMVKELVLVPNVQQLRTVDIGMTEYLSRDQDHSKVYFQSVPIRQ